MTRQTIILFILTTCKVASFGQKNEKLYYKTGELELTSIFDSICGCNKVTEYYQGGKIKTTRSHKNFQTQGTDITYFENGVIMLYYFWKDGAPEGRIYSNFSNGKLGYEKFYSNKFKSGIWKIYNEDGTLNKEQIYEDGKTAWNSDLDYTTNKYYLNGKLAYTENVFAGKKNNTIINDTVSYNTLIAREPPLGQKLFIQNCSPCHGANVDIVGPKMKGITKNRSDDWLMKMITNGDALIKSGDKDAVMLYKKWGNIQHPNFERLTKDEVQAIIDYLKTLQ